MSPIKIFLKCLENKKTYLAISLGALIIFLLVAYVGFLNVWKKLKIIDPSLFLIIFALTVLGTIIAAIRFHFFLRVHRSRIKYKDVYHINTVGIVGNLLTLGDIGGDFFRILLLKNYGIRASRSITSVILIKILDFLIAMSLSIALAFLIFWNLNVLIPSLIFAFFLCFFVIVLLVRRGYVYRVVRKILSIVKIKEKPKKIDLPKSLAFAIVLLTFARWLIFGLQDYLVINAFGLNLSFMIILAIYSVNLFVITFSPLPLGIAEAATVGLYSYFGATLSEAMSIALIARTWVSFTLILLGVYSGLRIGLSTIKRLKTAHGHSL